MACRAVPGGAILTRPLPRPMRLSYSVLVFSLALAACDTAASDQAPTFGDPYTVLVTADTPAVAADGRLAVTVEYGGGCEEHAFVLRSRVDGGEASVWWVHDARGDTCEALQRATVRAALPGAVLDADRVTLLAPSGFEVRLQLPAP